MQRKGTLGKYILMHLTTVLGHFTLRVRRIGIIYASGPKSVFSVSFSATSISYKGMEIFVIWRFRYFSYISYSYCACAETAHAQKQQFLRLRLQFWCHWIQRARFPLKGGNFGNQEAFTAVLGHLSLHMRRIGIIYPSGPKSVITVVLSDIDFP